MSSQQALSVTLCLLLTILCGACVLKGEEAAQAPVAETVAAPAPTPGADTAAPAVDPQAEEQAIRRLSQEQIALYRARNTDSLGAFYADNAVSISSTGERDQGRETIQKGYAEWFAQLDRQGPGTEITWEPTDVVVSDARDMAHETGEWRITGNAANARQGRYLTVWQKLNREWKIVREVSVIEAAPAQRQPPATAR